MLAAVAAVAGCGEALPGLYLTNIRQVEAAIAATAQAHDHRPATAYCPASVPAIRGETFSCVVAIDGYRHPAEYRATVKGLTEAAGYVTYAETRPPS
jgi:hypothetical protein